MVSVVPTGQLVYGMQLPVQAQSTIFAEGWEASAGATELAAIARQADRSGFFYIAVCDHVAIPRDLAPKMSTTWYDTTTTLGFLAGITERVRLLSHVYVPAYRHPLVAAKAFLTLDAVSNGRAIVGVGAGHVEDEFALLGADFANRGGLLDEAIDVIRAALTDEFPEIETPHYSVRDAGMRPRPVQQPRPPIWVGGSSPAAIRRAAQRGDGWLPQGNPPKKMPDMVQSLREQRRAAIGDEPVDIGALVELIHVGDPGDLELGPWSLSGSADRIAEGLRAWSERGANHLQVRFPNRSVAELLDQMEAFGAEVAPLLND